WRECTGYAIERGADLETFSGLAGVGDLTATMMAPTGRNRRAGELLGTGTPAGEIPAQIGQASEGLDAVPLLAEAIAAAGRPAARARRRPPQPPCAGGRSTPRPGSAGCAGSGGRGGRREPGASRNRLQACPRTSSRRVSILPRRRSSTAPSNSFTAPTCATST